MLTLMYPRWKSLLRSTSLTGGKRYRLSRAVVTLLFMLSLFLIANHILQSVKQTGEALPFPIILIIAPLTFLFFTLAFISSIFCNLIYFFQARDTEQIIASPIQPSKFFTQRSMLAGLTSYWMALIFIAPIIAATILQYHNRIPALTLCGVVIAPSLLIPINLSYCLVVLCLYFVPLHLLSRFFRFVIFIGIVWIVLQNIASSHRDTVANPLPALSTLNTLQLAFSKFLPSYWMARLLALSYEGKTWDLGSFISLVFATIGSSALALSVHELCHQRAYANYHNPWRLKSLSQPLRAKAYILLGKFPAKLSAIGRAELLQFMRLPGQFLTVAGYMLVLLIAISECPLPSDFASSENLWHPIGELLGLALFNLTQCSIYCATMTRTSYISPSIESDGGWLLTASPHSPSYILKEKLRLWMFLYLSALLISSLYGLWQLDIPLHYYPIQILMCIAFCKINTVESLRAGARNRLHRWDHLHQLTISLSAALFSLKALFNTLVILGFYALLFALQLVVSEILPINAGWLAPILIFFLGYYALHLYYQRLKRLLEDDANDANVD